MAYVNVLDWSVEQVTEWLKGLDSTITPYAKSFLNNEVKGHQLLNLRSDDLEHLGVLTLGHQELILEAVEYLRNFHYKLDKENLQMLALRLSCAANSLCKELALTDENCTIVPTQTMSDVHNVITSIKPLVCWLDRTPFRGDKDYFDCKTQLLQLSFEMATSAHRDIFSEKPIRTIRNISDTLAKLADHIIQEISDPMILQPASLALATLKKKEQDLGFCLLPTNSAVHQIVDIKYGSPAHNSSKIEDGDEIVQVNYQTVVGWQRKNVLLLLQESPPEIVLTLKKRPRHTKVYGQIYMKPYRLPSKKRATPYSRWNDNLPSPQLLAIHDLPQIPAPRLTPVVTQPENETDISSSSDSEPLDSPLDGGPGRVYPLKPRPVLQRRNTITGATPTSKRPNQAIEQFWQQLKNQAASKHASAYNIESNQYIESSLLRDKSASCGDTFDLIPRPTTVIGLTQTKSANSGYKNQLQEKSFKKKKVNFEDTTKTENNNISTNLNEEHSISVNSLSSLSEAIDFIDEGVDLTDRSNMKAEWQKQIVEEIIDAINFESILKLREIYEPHKDSALADVHVHNIIKKFDEQHLEAGKPKIFPKNLVEKPPELPQKPHKKPVVPPKNLKLRGTLNKSHSTPAYDQGSDNSNESIKEADPIGVPKSNSYAVISNEPIKYELGIPIVEACSLHYLNEKNSQDIPPKPPPRIIFPSNAMKYKCSSDTPKLDSHITKHGSSTDVTSHSTALSHSSSSISQSQTSIDSLSRIPEYSTAEYHHKMKPLGSTDNLYNFEPKSVSTPISKHYETDYPYAKVSPNLDSNKLVPDNKISPTNSIVRAMMYSSKSKSVKKKNSLIAKRRNVTVKDVTPGELQGYLYQRLRSRQNQTAHWEKRWFVLNASSLYGFKTKESPRAECLIFLSGYTASIAAEVKSRSNAFKVYHTGTVFYFSAEDAEMLTSWIELITAATLLYDGTKSTTEVALYSETDDSDSDKPKSMPDKTTNSLKKVGTTKKPAQSGSSSLDRKWFFNKSNSAYKNSLPVPTAQFRSYRKIPSSTINVTESMSTGNFTSHIPDFSPRFEVQSNSTSSTSLISDVAKKEDLNKSAKNKQKPLNYVHASNPNLCDITDFHLRNFNKLQTFQPCSDNLAGFVTLEELMIRQSEEQKLNPHALSNMAINPSLIRADVVYGEVPIRSTKEQEVVKKPTHSRTTSDCSDAIASNSSNSRKSSHVDLGPVTTKSRDSTSFCFGKRPSFKRHKKEKESYDACTYPKVKGYEEKLNQSLPRSNKLQDKLNCVNKEYSVSYIDLKDKSSELVYSKQTHNNANFAQNRSLERKITRQHSLTNVDKKQTKICGYVPGTSPERIWIESLRKNEKSDKHSKNKLKSALQYTPMAMPLTPDPKLNSTFAFELNLDEKVSKSSKIKNFFKSDSKREKQISSPKLQRKLFESREDSLRWHPRSNEVDCHIEADFCYKMVDDQRVQTPSLQTVPSTDYPGLEYPPVFEPETYSLSDPQCSISLRRQGRSN